MGDNNDFPSIIANLLKEGNTVQALNLFTDNKNSEEVCNNSWDLVPIVAQYLTADCEYNKIEVYKCCQKLIAIIAERSKPEEVLLQFIEEIEEAKEDTKFLTLLKPLESVLLRVPDKRITSLGWCFNAIKKYLDELETPEDWNLVYEERLLLDSNEIVNRIVNLYNELLIFCDVFVSELLKAGAGRSTRERKQIILKFLLELLGKPLAFLDMEMFKNTKPKARIISERLIEQFYKLSSDPYLFLEMKDSDHGGDLIKPNDLSLGVFYYLIISQEVCVKYTPKIYDSGYILHNTLKLVDTLLKQDGQFVIEKGIHLAESLVKSLDHLELSYLLLDSEHHSNFCGVISNIIIHNELQNIRRESLKLLHNYLWSFEHQGRYLIIINLMRTLTHSGLKGNLVTQYKEMITQEISTVTLHNLSKYYKNRKLYDLLDEFTCLRYKEETDLVDESDQIVSTLNFLRYLVIVDKDDDTGVKSYLDKLGNGYFKQLKTGIQLSQEHYRLKVKQVMEEGDFKKDCQVSMTVSGKNLIEMPIEKKVEIMNLSLTTLDVIDSLLSRLVECINVE